MLQKALLILVVCCSLATYGQDEKTLRLYRTTPVWINMIDNPQTNYFEALKAFDLFWEGKVLPAEEEEILGEKYSDEEKRRGLFSFLFRKEEQNREYAFELKRFRNWQREVLPLVQEDGRILSKEEELEIYNTQKPQ
jgi:hypothetical protein